MAIPSIALIPSGYKAQKVYSVLPTNGDADLTFARASSAVRVNQSDLLETVTTGVPRLDYSDGGCPSLLLEPQSTNLMTYSEDFTQWSVIGTPIVTSNYSISPKGILEADRIQLDLGDKVYLTSNQSGSLTFSIYLKGSGTVDLRDSDNSSRLTVALTNQWVRYSFSFNEPISNIQISQVTGSSDFSAWGAQLEQQSYATSYIATAGAIATRLAETASKTGLASYINSTEGVLYFSAKALANNLTFRFISLSDGTTANCIQVYWRTSSNQLVFAYIKNSVITSNITYTLSDITQLNKYAVKWKENDFALWINGVEVAVNSNGGVLTSSILNRLAFDNGSGSSVFYSETKDLRVYNTALTDAELTTLTTL